MELEQLKAKLNGLMNKKILNEGDVVSFADYKAKKEGKPVDDVKDIEDADVFTDLPTKDNVVNVHIDSVTVTFVEGKQGDNRFIYNKPYSYEEIQAKINEEDYKVANVDVQHGGYDKFYYDAEITIDGQKETYKDGRLDLGDGFRYGAENVSIKYMISYYLPKIGFEGKTIVIDNPDVKYDTAGYMLKYGTREENIDKYIAEHKVELPQGIDYSIKPNVEVGDIFYYSDYSDYGNNYFYRFFKVIRTTKSSAWVEPLDSSIIKVPVKIQDKHDNRVMIDDDRYVIPKDEKIEFRNGLYGIQLEKPFKIDKDYNNKPMLRQGSRSKVYLSAWNGNALKESLDIVKSNKKRINEDMNKSEKLNKLKEIENEVRNKINELYADDKDLLDYFHVESGVEEGHYDDGSDMYFIEVRGELSYDEMCNLADELDTIVEKYDEYAYFDMVTGGIMDAVIVFDRKEPEYRVVIKDKDGTISNLKYDTYEEALDICRDIINSPNRDEIMNLNIEKLDGEEYKVIKPLINMIKSIGESLKENSKKWYHVEVYTKEDLSDKDNFNAYHERLDSFETIKEAEDYIKGLPSYSNYNPSYGIWSSEYTYSDTGIPDEDIETLKLEKFIPAKVINKIKTVSENAEDYIDVVVPYDLAVYISNGDRTPIDFDKETYEPMFDKADEYERLGDVEILDDTEDYDVMTDDFGFQNHVVTIRIHKRDKNMNEKVKQFYQSVARKTGLDKRVEYKKRLNAGTEYLKNIAKENGWKEYEIVEDSKEYPNGLLLIGYSDKEHENEIDHVCINLFGNEKTGCPLNLVESDNRFYPIRHAISRYMEDNQIDWEDIPEIEELRKEIAERSSVKDATDEEILNAIEKMKKAEKGIIESLNEDSNKYLTKEQLIAEVSKGNLPDEYVPFDIGQGYGYKIDKSWDEITDDNIVIYIPEYGYESNDNGDWLPTNDSIYTKADFREITKELGKRAEEEAAYLFTAVDWMYPETLWDEMDTDEEDDFNESLKPFKLTNADKSKLLDWGYEERDFSQIEEASKSNFTKYELDDEPITRDKAIEILGREEYLSGLARSAFHWSCVREGKNGEEIYFDSSNLFK